ncbi:DUF1178 family protein [Erythrobacter sp. JK5]|uniref:DUF1178 family protein n=1 Tax=Erythrobacter sp. JK5 TaxID=2829500 RepID=UPI001BA72567|nr:DUF1178 family protein [Erythrobacter sp. JK5]QUL38665.1 DUF1178 family protein [Erythrobacter sp. JK5]
MIVFDLHCDEGHRFEGWFGSSGDYESQRERGLVACPECGSGEVGKAPMAPAVPVKGNRRREAGQPVAPETDGTTSVSNHGLTPEVKRAMQALAEAQAKALKDSTYVGDKFAEQSRAMHYGERDEAPIHGRASLEDAKALVDEGVPVAPLPFPVAPPDELN